MPPALPSPPLPSLPIPQELCVLLFTLYGALFLSAPALNQAGRAAVSVILIAINVITSVIFIAMAVRAYWSAAYREIGLHKQQVLSMDYRSIQSHISRNQGVVKSYLLLPLITAIRATNSVQVGGRGETGGGR